MEIIGYVPHTRQTETTGLWWSGDFDPDYIEECAVAHEQAGFDSVLVGASSWGPDGFQIAAHVLRSTQRLKVLVAHRPGFTQPTLAARQAITLDRLHGDGRVALHIITGTRDELRRDGDTLPDAQRYERTAEYMDVLRQTWEASAPFDHAGSHYQISQGFSSVRPAAPLHLSFAGSSAAALATSASHADLHMLWGEPLAGIEETIAAVRTQAVRLSRPGPRFSVSLRAVLGQTEDDAWHNATALLQQAAEQMQRSSADPAELRQAAFKLDSAGALRLDDYAREDVQDERLWLGFTRLVGRGGSTSALVGTVPQFIDSYLRYAALGVDALYLRGWDIAADARRYGQALIPALRAAQTAPTPLASGL